MTPQADTGERARERAQNFGDLFSGRGVKDNYRGIPIFAAPGLHEAAIDLLQAECPDARATRVLELGAGSGPMSLRMHDHGYQVLASDLFPERFAPTALIPFITLDLNRDFSSQLGDAGFDAIIALELVEHLENPMHFLRQCAALLAAGGTLVLSTPNLANPVSQAQFIRSGDFQWFTDADYKEQGHITPIAPGVLARAWREAGFDVVRLASVSNPGRRLKWHRQPLTWLLATGLRLFSGQPRHLRGEVFIAVLRRNDIKPG